MGNMERNDRKRVLQLASVASMIDLFNADNINILIGQNCQVEVAANFQEGSITSKERVAEYKEELLRRDIVVHDVPIPRSIFHIGAIIKSYRQIKELVEEKHYKMVHCHSPIGGVIARLACRKIRKTGTKVIYTGHGLHFFKGAPLLNWLIFYPVERFCAYLTDVIIAINQEDYHREQSWKACKIEYVPGIGVDTKSFQQENINRESMRKEFGFDENDFVFMSTGQISVRKNHEVAIRALAVLNNKHIKYLIVGFGELEEKLRKLSADIGVDDQVVFAGYRGDVKELLHIVDGFVFPSLQEGLPVALMEAMAAGLPIVCSRIRGNVDLIKNGEGGYMYDSHDINGFADGMRLIAKGEEATDEMGKKNKENIAGFDKAIINRQMERIYKEQLEIN